MGNLLGFEGFLLNLGIALPVLYGYFILRFKMLKDEIRKEALNFSKDGYPITTEKHKKSIEALDTSENIRYFLYTTLLFLLFILTNNWFYLDSSGVPQHIKLINQTLTVLSSFSYLAIEFRYGHPLWIMKLVPVLQDPSDKILQDIEDEN